MFPLCHYFRSECDLLPIPGFYHLPQLAAGETANVLVGPKPALRKERGRHNGEHDHRKRIKCISIYCEDPHSVMVCSVLYRNML